MTQNIMSVLWPAFLVAGIAEGALFTVFDPLELHLFGDPMPLPRTAVYSLGFFLLWGVTMLSSALTLFMQTSERNADLKD